MAISYSITYTFSPSTTISSSQVNQNFTDNKGTWDGIEAKTKTFSNLGVDTQFKSGGTIESANGTVAAPGITFTSDTDNGIYRVGSDNIALAAGGVKQVDITTAGTAIRGTTTNDAGATGFVGEYIETGAVSGTFPAAGVAADAGSISLTAGDWDVMVQGNATNGQTTVAGIRFGASTTSGNSTAGLTNGVSQLLFSVSGTGAALASQTTCALPRIRFSLASTTTIYFKVFSDAWTTAAPTYIGNMNARRTR